MFKRIVFALPLIVAGLIVMFVIPGYLERAPEWYYRLPSVLPSSTWSTVMCIVGVLLLGFGFVALFFPAINPRRPSSKIDLPHQDASKRSVTLIFEGRRVVGPPALIRALGTGTATIRVNGLCVKPDGEPWTSGHVSLNGSTLNGVPFEQIEYAEE